MTSMNDDEIKAECIAAMGDDLGREFHEINNELVWVNDKWREFSTLFGRSEAAIDILNESASRFFGGLQDILWEDALLHIARITDRSDEKRPTITIQRLPSLINDEALKAEVLELVAKAVTASRFARDWRNRHIAHRDLALALEHAAKPLASGSRQSVRASLDAIAEVLVRIHEHYLDGGLSFDIPGGPGDAGDLLRVLDEGNRAVRAREARFEAGTWTEDDFVPRGAV